MSTATHTPIVLSKQADEWTNELGQTFPAITLYRCECSCGEWKGLAWYGSRDKALAHFNRHAATHV